jgi:phosphoribosylaminoimidazole-succinocarboxamide synthase
MRQALMTTKLALPNRRTGKVRDLYDTTLPDGSPGILIIATDRISAFDVVMSNGLPGKGIVLTQLSRFWFDRFAATVKHHLVSTDVADVVGLTDAERTLLAAVSCCAARST